MLCGQDVSLIMHDRRKSKLVMYKNTEEFNSNKIEFLYNALGENDLFENYTNRDYGSVCDTKVITC